MAVYQILVKLLDGRTHCLQIPSPTLTGEYLKTILFEKTGIPFALQRLVSGTHDISEDAFLSASDGGFFPSCALLLRLRGGKGGFGSLLRGAATKAGQKKTSNFDACRDMSGRRLRHVNAEKRLEDWRAEAEERRLEKIAEEFIRKKEKEVRKKKGGGDVEKYLEKYREDAAKCMEKVEESVRESFELYKEAKRKVLPAAGPDNKRLKIWLGKKVDESDSDEDDDEDEDEEEVGDAKSVVLDAGSSEARVEEDEGSQASVSGAHSDGESSGGGSGQSNLEEENGKCGQVCMETSESEGSRSGDSNADSDGPTEPEMRVNEEIAAEEAVMVVSSSEELLDSDEPKSVIERPVELDVEMGKPVTFEIATERPVESEAAHEELVAQSNDASAQEESLDFDKFDSAAKLEVLGMERLKTELQTHGMKCGGTLQERAARLFLLKTTPLEKLPKKVLAKPAGYGK